MRPLLILLLIHTFVQIYQQAGGHFLFMRSECSIYNVKSMFVGKDGFLNNVLHIKKIIIKIKKTKPIRVRKKH